MTTKGPIQAVDAPAGFLARWWSLLAYVLRVALAAVFLIAAWTKLTNVTGALEGARGAETFAEAIMAYRLGLPEWLVAWSTFTIPIAELLVGVALVLGLWTRAAALVYVLLLAAFTAGVMSVISRGLNITCGCFGDFKLYCEGAIGWCKVAENGVLAGLAGLLLIFGPGRMSLDWVNRS